MHAGCQLRIWDMHTTPIEQTEPMTLRDVVPQALATAEPGTRLERPMSRRIGTGTHGEAMLLAAWCVVVDRLRGASAGSFAVGQSGESVAAIADPGDDTWATWLGRVAASLAAPMPAGSLVTAAQFAWCGAAPKSPVSGSELLAVGFLIGDDGVSLALHGGAWSIDPSAGTTLLDSWAFVLEQAMGRPDQRVRDLVAVRPDDLARQNGPWQGDPWPHRGSLSVVTCFAETANEYPHAPALRWNDGELDYTALLAAASSLASRLVAAGVQPGQTVALALRREPRAVVAMLAILHCGATYMPLDEAYPADRQAFMLADAGVQIVLVDDSPPSSLPSMLLRLDVGLVDTAAPWCATAVAADDSGERVAYIMYTSGSTGQPKGVEICERSIVRLVKGCSFMRLDPTVAMLQAAPLGFDASTLEIWGPLLNGGCCVVHDEAVPTGPGLAASIQRHRVTSAWLTAALFNAVVDDEPQHLHGLKELLTGGEALSVHHVTRAQQALPGLQLFNGYGPTETTTFAATHRIPAGFDPRSRSVPIGKPISASRLLVLNPRREPVPAGMVGELWIGGLGVARGYHGRPDLTAERFADDPQGPAGAKLYRTGDLVRWLPDGTIDFIGRADGQIKIRGFRIETGEIELALASHPEVRACAVVGRRDPDRGAELIAYVVAPTAAVSTAALREHLAARLPDFMVPALWVRLDALPVTPNGKLDRRALPAPHRERPDHLTQTYVAPRAGLEHDIAEVFARVIGIDRVGALDNFFDLGGNSLLIMKAFSALRAAGHPQLAVATMFADPTVRGLAGALGGGTKASPARPARRASQGDNEPIAIVGMAGRFPGAPDVESFWRLLDEGRDSIRFFKPEELDASIPADLRADPAYVSARGVVDGVDLFDAAFFGITAREAELMDPQQRVFLELCWECLERAGQVPEKTADTIGVFAGMYNATYFQRHVLAHPDKVARLGDFQVMLANEKDYIATRTAHKLNLTGPAVSVHTACSTSLVAIAQAFDALRGGHCGLALAGGSSITCPPNSGYLYQEGSMLSPDGHTRSFDADAQGTVFSDGAAVVLLKRLTDAIADGNTIHAVIRGVAINNDGASKASFTAPSVDGQAAVVSTALAHAGVDARSISYVETHGTATPLGDPVEVAALNQAFRHYTADVGFCTIGSLKSNTGHMVIAAGAAGVIKTAMALAAERLPGTAHFKMPNPKIDFAGSPFVVHAQSTPWPRGALPRRAGVSSFGVGGTNAHAVLEEAPLLAPTPASRGPQLLRLSARTRPALESAIARLAAHLDAHPEINLGDAAHTLDIGRRDFAERTFVVASTVVEAAAALRGGGDGARARIRSMSSGEPAPVFLFPGQGAQYAGMGRELYATRSTFARAFDECLAALEGHVSFDLRALMFGDDAAALANTEITQPATFAIEYAMARDWLEQGLQPAAMIGHSIGEFVAAVLAGVMPLEHAVRLVARRGALMQALPSGSMLSLRLNAAELEPLLPPELQLAAENGPTACVVAGPTPAIEAFAAKMAERNIVGRVLQTSHAFHSAMMDPALPEFVDAVRAVPLAPPSLRIFSTVTGQRLTDAQATDPMYWARHLREPVRFSPAVRTAIADVGGAVFVECGPRGTMSTLVRQHRGSNGSPIAIASLADAPALEVHTLTEAAGQLWTLGVGLPTPAFHAAGRRRIVLPSYAFDRQRHWVDAAPRMAQPAPMVATAPMLIAPAPTPIQPLVETPAMANRRPALIQRLRSVFEDVSGIELADADAASNFVELGLDSLTLTQVALQLKKEFSLPITFRQLMESYRSFDALSAFLDEKMPADATPAVAAVVAAPAATIAAVAAPAASVQMAMQPLAMPAVQPSAPAGTAVQQLIQQQMQLMAQQLALLQGQPMVLPTAQPVAASALPAAAPVAAVAAPASAPAASAPSAVGAAASGAETEAEIEHRTYDVKKAFGAIARIHTSATEITDRQRARLDAFMRRYIEKTKRSKAYTVEHRPHLADPRVVNGFRPALKEIIYQIVIDRSKGSHMWDIDGNEYVDALNGFGMSMFGWQPDFVLSEVRKQLDGGYDIGPQHPLAGEVARLFCKITGFDRAGLCNTGSEAVMGCVRIARTITGRSKIAIFSGAYHGIFDEVIVRGTKKLKSIPAAPGILPNTAENVVVLDYGTPETMQWIKNNADDLAAVLVEPVQSRRPDFQPREFLRELRTVTEKAGTLLIFDEVVTGFRCHPGGIQALFGIRADLGAYGKVVGGGFPIGVIAGKREFMDALDGGHWEFGDESIPTVGVTYFAGTFVRHPLALVAAKAVLEHIEREGPELQATLTRTTAAMVDELNAFCRENGAPIVLKSFSSVWKVFFLEDHPMQDLLFAMMRNRGVHILDNFPCFMTTAHTAQDIGTIKTAFKEAVIELQEADFIPRRAAPAAARFDASRPPMPGARLGRDADGNPAWFAANPNAPGKYVKVEMQ